MEVPSIENEDEWTKEEVTEAAEVASLRAEVAHAEEQLKQTEKDMKKAKSEALAAAASAKAKLTVSEQKAVEEAAAGKKKTDAPVKLAEAAQSQKTEILKAAQAAEKAALADEARRAEAAKKAAEAAQIAKAAKKAEAAKRIEEQKRLLAAKRAADMKKEAEEATKAEAAKKAARQAADEAKKAEDAKKAEEAKKVEAKDITGDVTKVGHDPVKKAQEEGKNTSEEAKKAEVVKKLEDEAPHKAEEIRKAKAEQKAPEAPKETREAAKKPADASKKTEGTEEVAIKSHEPQQVFYGNPKCQCIGFSGVQGNRLVMLGGNFVEFPGDLGSSCKAWDDGVHPACQAGTKPGKGKDWCAQPWCFVDPRKCNIQELPEMSTYLPTARYQKMPLFVSLSTCDKKPRTDVAGPLGLQKCSCIGFDNAPGTMKLQIGAASVTYPAETGGTCGAWDMDSNPLCAVKGEKPDFCTKKWCFVDPCSCDIGALPKVSAALFDVSFAGKKVYYSYETCGDMDVYTSNFNKVACVIEKSQDACSKKAHCSWKASKCLGKELVDKAVCGADAGATESAKENTKAPVIETQKSSAQQQGMFGAMMAGLLMSFSLV
eukprot:TRINITY_DN1452_c0_g2_i1.p1 TRINITY_DN1452_c0_g2~~TRINITY_DN1452_c0_g2_i1.p1  ORF type:complete len:668 (-),score=215.43 TRINITY_DN1452_c0_g2_i1:49-1848(-)